MLTFAVLVVLYFLPSILARNKPSFTGILLLNLFLGWTVIGWIGALVWALSEHECPVYVATAPVRYCCACGQPTAAAYCAYCGRAWSH